MDIIIDAVRIRFSEDPTLFDQHKPTIIFLHDSLGCIELWRDFPKKVALATGCNILAYDRQGYGQSDPFSISKRNNTYLKTEAEVLGKIIDYFDLKKVILFGHSDGGSIALLAGALYPDKIHGIITEGAHVFVEQETIKGIKNAVEFYKNTNLKEKLSKYHGNKTESVFNLWTETWLSETYQSWNIEQYLTKIQCPCLIIQGEKDEYGTVDQVNSIVKHTSREATTLLIPEIGHTPHKEAVDVVLKQTTSFIFKTLNL